MWPYVMFGILSADFGALVYFITPLDRLESLGVGALITIALVVIDVITGFDLRDNL